MNKSIFFFGIFLCLNSETVKAENNFTLDCSLHTEITFMPNNGGPHVVSKPQDYIFTISFAPNNIAIGKSNDEYSSAVRLSVTTTETQYFLENLGQTDPRMTSNSRSINRSTGIYSGASTFVSTDGFTYFMTSGPCALANKKPKF